MNAYNIVPRLARPMNVDRFQVITIDYAEVNGQLGVFLEYITGREPQYIVDFDIDALIRALAAVSTVQDEYLLDRIMPLALQPGDLTALDRFSVLQAVDSLRKKGISFVLLRGSEVSLDRLVQHQVSSPDDTCIY